MQAELSFQHKDLLDDADRYKIDVARADQIAKEERDRRMEAMHECEKLQEHVVSLKSLVTREGLVNHPLVCMYVCVYMCVYVCTHVCEKLQEHVVSLKSLVTREHTYIHTYIHKHIHTYIHYQDMQRRKRG